MHPCRGALRGAATRLGDCGARYHHSASAHGCQDARLCRTANVARGCDNVDTCTSRWTMTCVAHSRHTATVPAFHYRHGLLVARGVTPDSSCRAFHTDVGTHANARAEVNYRGFHRCDLRGIEWFPNKAELMARADAEHKHQPIIAERYLSMSPKKGAVFKYAHVENHDILLELSRTHAPTSFFEVLHEDSPRCLYFDIDSKVEHKAREGEIVSTLTKFVEQHLEMENLQPVVLRNPQMEKMSIHVIFPEVQFPDHLVQCYHVPRLLHEMKKSSDLLDEVVDPSPYSRFQLYRAPFAAKMSKTNGLLVGTTFELVTEAFRDDPKTMFAGYVNAKYRRQLPAPQPWLPVTLRRHGFRSGISDINCLFQQKFEQPERTGTFIFEGTPVKCLKQALELINPTRASHWWSWFRISGIMYRLMHPDYVLPPRPLPPLPTPTPSQDDSGSIKDNDSSDNDYEPGQVNGGIMLPSKVNALLSKAMTGESGTATSADVLSEELLEEFLKWSQNYPTYDRAENLDMVYGCEGRPVSGSWLLSHIVIFDNPNMHFPQLCHDTSEKQEYAIR